MKLQISYKIELFVLSILFLIQFFYVNDPFYIGGLFLAFFLFWELKKRIKIVVSYIDICILLIWIYGLFSLLYSVYPLCSFNCFKVETYSLFYYFLLRFLFQDRLKMNRLLLIFSAWIGFLSVIALVYFIWFKNVILSLDFSELYDFRYLLKPLGVPNNEWATFQLLFIGIIILAGYLYRNNGKVLGALTIVGLLVLFQAVASFSRGVYISLFLFVIGIFAVLRGSLFNKRMICIGSLFAGVLFIAFLCNKDDVFKTLKMVESVSQQRSIDNRVNTFDAAKQFIKEKPFGGGSGNYQLLMDKYLYGNDHMEFTSYASNLVSRLLVEKGIIGLFFYLLLVIAIIIHCGRSRNKLGFLVLVILLVFAFREQTFSIFQTSLPVQLLVYTIIAVSQQGKSRNREWIVYNNKYIRVMPLLVWGAIFTVTVLRMQERKHNVAFIKAMKVGNMDLAKAEIERTTLAFPYLMNRSLFYMQMYDTTHDNLWLIKGEKCIRQSIEKNSYDLQSYYYLALIQYRLGKKQDALFILNSLLQKYPNNTLWQWEIFRVLYHGNEKKQAAIHLAECVELSPRIMDTEIWIEYAQKDSAFFQQVNNILTNKIKIIDGDTSPILLSKYGKIAFNLGEVALAEKYLYLALEQLPNLSMAWYNLGQIRAGESFSTQSKLFEKRALVMNLGIFAQDISFQNHHNVESFLNRQKDINVLLYGKYRFKFGEWYKDELLVLGEASLD